MRLLEWINVIKDHNFVCPYLKNKTKNMYGCGVLDNRHVLLGAY